MRIHLIALGKRPPLWVQQGYETFAKRLPPHCALKLAEIRDGKRMAAAIPSNSLVIALEVGGEPWSTEMLARNLEAWLAGGRDVALLVGGPEGLPEDARALANRAWSLSPLTFPHALVRIVVAEQIYRAWSLLQRHPYHRAG
ncbi:MAG: 23S rRNA (pseudouridine(1915)-N(3))-methyltransferase RlmH [Gammaproteobacteria bacterium]|nr:MAG: 23S rRNA (pseudouridine(1915)-N(3))-methyltransferase RlmH [Gammaproteobacteria bacterium]